MSLHAQQKKLERTTYFAVVRILHGNSACPAIGNVVDCHHPLLVRVVAGAVEFRDLAEGTSSPLCNNLAFSAVLRFTTMEDVIPMIGRIDRFLGARLDW